MTLLANVPVADFWAITLYDTQTRSQLQTDQQFPTLDTYTEGLLANEDGSYTIYYGPEAPAGKESNWLQTIPGKASSSVCACTGRPSRGSRAVGGQVTSSWWSDGLVIGPFWGYPLGATRRTLIHVQLSRASWPSRPPHGGC